MSKIFWVGVVFKEVAGTCHYYVEAENRKEAIDKCCSPWFSSCKVTPDIKRCKTKQMSFKVPVYV